MATADNSHTWRRSSHCDAGSCVEITDIGGEVAVRHTAEPDEYLIFSRDAWRSFLAGVRAGEFDPPPALGGFTPIDLC